MVAGSVVTAFGIRTRLWGHKSPYISSHFCTPRNQTALCVLTSTSLRAGLYEHHPSDADYSLFPSLSPLAVCTRPTLWEAGFRLSMQTPAGRTYAAIPVFTPQGSSPKSPPPNRLRDRLDSGKLHGISARLWIPIIRAAVIARSPTQLLELCCYSRKPRVHAVSAKSVFSSINSYNWLLIQNFLSTLAEEVRNEAQNWTQNLYRIIIRVPT